MSMKLSRRDLLVAAPAAALVSRAGLALAAQGNNASGPGSGSASAAHPTAKQKPITAHMPGPICLFSKHLPKLAPGPLAVAAKKAGFTGIDLTVRPGGHVLPAEVTTALPIAVEAIRKEGLAVPLVTTELLSVDDPAARPTLAAAGKLGVPLFKPGYFKYAYDDVRKEMKDVGAKIKAMAALGKANKIALGFHNHGDCIGGSGWDALQIVEGLDPKWAGYYLDTRHVFAEGGQSAWKAVTSLIGPRVKMVSVKDFLWEKTAKGFAIKKVPLGQGMVDLEGIFRILAQQGFSGPISVHLEYAIEGGEDAVLAAAERDRKVLEKALAAVYGAV